MPRATGSGSSLSLYEEAWEAINRLIRRGGSWSGHERKCFYVQDSSGRFHNVSAVSGLDVIEDGRGLAVLDFDRDGDPDLVLKSRNAPQLRIWRNDVPRRGHRVLVELAGAGGKGGSNTQAIGARVVLRAGPHVRVKEICAGSGFLSQGSTRLHFGLGSAGRVDRLEVRWPAGRVDVFEDLAVDRAYDIREGEDGGRGRLVDRALEPPSPRGGAPAPAGGDPPGREPAVDALLRPLTVREETGPWLIDPVALPALRIEGRGGQVLLKSLLGDGPVLIHLWSPECPRCRGELEEWAAARGGEKAPAAPGAFPRVIAITRAPGPDPGPEHGPEHGAEAAREAREKARRIASAAGLDTWFADVESLLALGVFLEDIAHWPRDLGVPASLLTDGSGLLVRLYRGAVPWKEVARDAASIPAGVEERLRAALPFPGKYYSTELRRNLFQLGISYLEAGLLDHAAAALSASLEARPNQADALYNLGVIHQKKGETGRAREMFSRAIAEAPDFADARVNLGAILARDGDLDRAVEEFQRAISSRKDHVEALLNLGSAELGRGRGAQALEAFAAAARIEPGNAQAAKKVGDASRRMGDIEGARRAYARATVLAPGDPEAWSSLGAIQAQAGSLEAALASCRRAIEADGAYASAHNNAGLILEGLGRRPEAMESFRRAIDLSPELAAPYLNLARALLREGEDAEARKVVRKLLETHPDHPAGKDLLRRMGG